MITFYDCRTAPNPRRPRRPRILLAWKGVPHETVQVDLAVREQLGEALRRINPQCTVPALRLDDRTVLTDNAGIVAWIEACYPDPLMLGRTPLAKAEVASWQWRIEYEGMTAIADALRNGSPAMVNRALPGPVDYSQIPELAQRGLARVQHFFDSLDARLAGRETVAGSGLSIADITAVAAVDFARVIRVRPGEQQVHLRRWREAMDRRPSMAN